MTWKSNVDEIARRKALAKKMGGTENVARHHKAGKLTARERIDKIGGNFVLARFAVRRYGSPGRDQHSDPVVHDFRDFLKNIYMII
jgi:hypothetical protein